MRTGFKQEAAAHFQVLAIGDPCQWPALLSTTPGQSLLASAHWPLATTTLASTFEHQQHIGTRILISNSPYSHLFHHWPVAIPYLQTLMANLLATNIEST